MPHAIYKTVGSSLLMIAMVLSSGCKDDVIPQPPDNSKNEYTIKGKILNGTTMEPKYPGMVLNLVVSYKDFAETKTEVLGQCKMDNQGAFEITYKHSVIAENSSATLNFRSSFYQSPYLPKNLNLDTILYESSWAGGVINFKSDNPITSKDTFYVALIKDIYQFAGPMTTNEFRSFRCKKISGSFNNFWAIGKDSFNNVRTLSEEIVIHYDPSGDPIIDTLAIDY